MDIKKTIGTRINAAIARCGMLQKDLAKVLGVTDNTISYYCKGVRGPQLEQLPIIAETLNTTTDYLLGLTANPEPTSCAVDDLGLSPNAVDWIETLEKKAPCAEHDNRIFVLNFLLESNDFHLFFYNLCEYFYACRAECLYDELWDCAFPEKYLESVGLTPEMWADFRKKLPKVLDKRFIPNEIKDYLLATDELANSMSEANSHIVNVLTEVENFNLSDAIEYRISKYSRKLLEMIQQYAISEANIYARSESIIKLITTAYMTEETEE